VIALIDYHAGNLTSVKKALVAVGAQVFVPAAPEDLSDAAAMIVPGVGHFHATRALDARWRDAILASVQAGRPLLGICLGMQWLYESSEESPELRGAGLLPGRCVRLRPMPEAAMLKVPHVGWNSLSLRRTDGWIADGVPDESQVYFTHSYAAPVTGDAMAITVHGEPFAAIVERGITAGVQFHPEKSGEIGLQILRNFVRRAA